MRRTWYRRPAARCGRTLAPLAVAATMAAGATTVAGCAGRAAGGTEGPLPAHTAAANPTTPASVAPLPVRQQVIAAIRGYTVALGEADKSRNPAEARRLLQPYLAASRINGMVQTMSSIWAKGEVFYGQDILHVLSVTIRGPSAVVHDCDDTSGMGLEVAATGQVVQGSRGVPGENIVTTLDLTTGRWLVRFQLIEDVPCTA